MRFWCKLTAVLAATAAVTITSVVARPVEKRQDTSGCSLNIVAHEDDDLLFINPDILNDIRSNRCTRTVYLTAGDNKKPEWYWKGREEGIRNAYALITRVPYVPDSWETSTFDAAGKQLVLQTLKAGPFSVIFMRLPDGQQNGAGAAETQYQSLQKVREGEISQISSLDGANSFTKDDIASVLLAIMQDVRPSDIRTLDFTQPLKVIGQDDQYYHSDHVSTALFAQEAAKAYTGTFTLTSYLDYRTKELASNVEGEDFDIKSSAFRMYASSDAEACGSPPDCTNTNYEKWLSRKYITSSG